MVVLPTLGIEFGIDFIQKQISLMKIPLGKAVTIFGLTINPIVLSIIALSLTIGVILSWIFRKQIINFLKKAIKFFTGKDVDLK